MSAVFSHAVRCEFCGHNPISSGIPVGSGEKRGPSTGVRVSAKRQKSPLVLSPQEVILGLAQLEFRDQILVFLDGALGIRQGELGALRWLDCDFNNMNCVQHSYYWRRGGHLKSTKTEASAKLLRMHPSLKQALLEWRSLSLYNQPGDFVFPSERLKGKQTARPGFGVEEEDATGLQEDRCRGSKRIVFPLPQQPTCIYVGNEPRPRAQVRPPKLAYPNRLATTGGGRVEHSQSRTANPVGRF
jgi:integrase